MSSINNFYFKTMENEQIETTVHMHPDQRSCILGTLKDADGTAVQDALVLLFDGSEGATTLLSHMYTDENGQFYFGPLEPKRLHQIKIFKNQTKLRELEIYTEL